MDAAKLFYYQFCFVVKENISRERLFGKSGYPRQKSPEQLPKIKKPSEINQRAPA